MIIKTASIAVYTNRVEKQDGKPRNWYNYMYELNV